MTEHVAEKAQFIFEIGLQVVRADMDTDAGQHRGVFAEFAAYRRSQDLLQGGAQALALRVVERKGADDLQRRLAVAVRGGKGLALHLG